MSSNGKLFKGLRCLHCGERDAVVVRVSDMTLICEACWTRVEKKDIEEQFEKWRKFFAWIDVSSDLADLDDFVHDNTREDGEDSVEMVPGSTDDHKGGE